MNLVIYLAIWWAWIPLCVVFLIKGGHVNIARSFLLAMLMFLVNSILLLIFEFSILPFIGAIFGFVLVILSVLIYFNNRMKWQMK